MKSLETLTMQVREVALTAGRYLKEERKGFKPEAIQIKQAHDYVSYVDKESERRIVEALRKLLPEAGFVTEENTARYGEEAYCWIVDPLDGTTNYIHDNSPYCVSIALRDRCHLLIGVVYDPCLDECFYAWKGGGAWLNGKRLHVSTTNCMENAFFGVELPYNSDAYFHTALHLIKELYGKVGGVRMNGSAALALCYVAAGRFDGWLEAYIGLWDYSAGVLLVAEAGGEVTDFYGNALPSSHHIIATNGILHKELMRIAHDEMPRGI